ncbi:uncharacterized protein LOC120990872 [Bufo bufo]|uniref:uncharacterized protein LOC120990872 n=1 Tax=Bufo bufo TaxID=8384 RepID=UPI001ABE8CA5|nr:uncharacterized protein LOC120990872 [Bufo bufo]
MEAQKNNTRGRHSMGPHCQGRARHPLNEIRIQLVTLVVSMLMAGSASSGEDLGTNIGMASISLDGPGLLMVECLDGKILEPYKNVTFTPGQWYLYGFQREGFANGVIQHYTPVENVSAIQHDLHALCLKEYRHFQDLDPVPIKSLRWVSRNPHLHPYQQVRANTTTVLCTKEGLLSPEDVTGAEYSGWYILKATFLGKDSRDGLRVRTYFDRPIPVKGTLKAYCMLRDSQMTITRLQKIPLGFGKELRHLLMDFGQEEEIIQRLRETEKQATIQLTHDRTKIIAVATALDMDSKVSWWESLFGYSPKFLEFGSFLSILDAASTWKFKMSRNENPFQN